VNDDKEAFIFTGDLIDRGPDNIKLLQKLIELKTNHPKNVIITIGNRDLNKIRLVDEYFIEKTSLAMGVGTPCWAVKIGDASFTKFGELCSHVTEGFVTGHFKFKYNHTDLQTPFLGTKQAGWERFSDGMQSIFSEELKARVINVEEKTLGRFLHKENIAIDEFNTHFGKDEITPYNQYAAIAIMAMVMGCIWPEKDVPVFLRPFNGLYIKLLKQSHIISAFKAGDNKFGMASHAGIPIENNVFTLSDDLIELTTHVAAEPISLVAAIQNIDNAKNIILNNFVLKTCKYNPRNNVPGVNKLIQLAVCMADSKSPISHMSKLSERGPHALEALSQLVPPRNLRGENWQSGAANVAFEENQETIFYNIFGHQPAGYVPQVSVVGQVRNVCLDISKAESVMYGNKNSFALLVINGDQSDTLEGLITKDGAIYEYSKTFEDYNKEQKQTPATGFYLKHSPQKCSKHTENRKLTLIKQDAQETVKTFVVPGSYIQVLQTSSKMLPPFVPFKPLNRHLCKLIITSGDMSNFNGFIPVALYARTGQDLLYIMTVPARLRSTKDQTHVQTLINTCKTLIWNIWIENRIYDTQQHLYFMYRDQHGSLFYNDIDRYTDTSVDALKIYNNITNTYIERNDINGYFEIVPNAKYTSMLLDMTGPCSFYVVGNAISKFILDNVGLIDCVYFIGGIQVSQACSPEKANSLMQLLKNKMHIVMNNGDNNSVCRYGIPQFMEKYYEYFGETVDYIMLNYCKHARIKTISTFDIAVAMLLIQQISTYTTPPHKPDVIKSYMIKTNEAVEKLLSFHPDLLYPKPPKQDEKQAPPQPDIQRVNAKLVYDIKSGITLLGDDVGKYIYNALQDYYIEKYSENTSDDPYITMFHTLTLRKQFDIKKLSLQVSDALSNAHGKGMAFKRINRATIVVQLNGEYSIYPEMQCVHLNNVILTQYRNTYKTRYNNKLEQYDRNQHFRFYDHHKGARDRLYDIKTNVQFPDYHRVLDDTDIRKVRNIKLLPGWYNKDRQELDVSLFHNVSYLSILDERPDFTKDESSILRKSDYETLCKCDVYNLCELMCLGHNVNRVVMRNNLELALLLFDLAIIPGTSNDVKVYIYGRILQMLSSS
jgi:hypothetical protein